MSSRQPISINDLVSDPGEGPSIAMRRAASYDFDADENKNEIRVAQRVYD
jgi:hypothetical protein